MATYNYAVLTPDRTTITGTCDATGFDEALHRLEEDGAEVLSLVAIEDNGSIEKAGAKQQKSLEIVGSLRKQH